MQNIFLKLYESETTAAKPGNLFLLAIIGNVNASIFLICSLLKRCVSKRIKVKLCWAFLDKCKHFNYDYFLFGKKFQDRKGIQTAILAVKAFLQPHFIACHRSSKSSIHCSRGRISTLLRRKKLGRPEKEAIGSRTATILISLAFLTFHSPPLSPPPFCLADASSPPALSSALTCPEAWSFLASSWPLWSSWAERRERERRRSPHNYSSCVWERKVTFPHVRRRILALLINVHYMKNALTNS